jgi:hypothetical protein
MLMQDHLLSKIIGSPAQSEVSYQALMPRKVSNLLLVSSLYDYYTIIEDGKLSELLFSEYLKLELRATPSIERVSTAEEALARLQSETFDLVISMVRVGTMNVRQFGEAVHEINPTIPVILLAGSTRELAVLPRLEELPGIDTVFVWLGDVRLFLAIAKFIEDRHNAPHDTAIAGVKCILLVEDSIPFYSTYLPGLYSEIMKQTHALMAESVNRPQMIMRMRARPKVLLARTYEEGARLFEQYKDSLLGAVVDATFPKNGKLDPGAGFDLAHLMKEYAPDLPVVMQSEAHNSGHAERLGLKFINKESPTLLADLRDFMQDELGFGDFIVRHLDGTVFSRATDLMTLEWAIQAMDDELILPNVSRHDFFAWFLARTEFDLADTIRTIVRKYSGSPRVLRDDLLQALRSFRQRSTSGIVADFSSRTSEGRSSFVRIGSGSLGGKGRGLAFVNSLLNTYQLESKFPGVRVTVPATAVVTTEVFDRFMASSGLLPYALAETDESNITRAFLQAGFPSDVQENLWNFLQWVRYPLAVRSSSLLEDASFQPFAGIYKTYMIPNNHSDPEVRLRDLCNAIKMVYASTYHADPKAYIESLPNRLEEEKMAVVIQRLVGSRFGSNFYPHFAGVGRSMNYYSMPGMKPDDGVVSVALGLGKTVVDGGRCVRFCPAYPANPVQSFTPEDYLENSQRAFLALDLSRQPSRPGGVEESALDLVSLDLEVAERDGTLNAVGSVYSADNQAVYDGISRPGVRLVTMAGILKGDLFPLAEIMSFLLTVGAAASSCPVEIEFAATLSDSPDRPHEFAFLQIRPLAVGAELHETRVDRVDPSAAICVSNRALGNGLIGDIRDVIYVRMKGFDRTMTSRIAQQVGTLNQTLKKQKRPYLLIGPGRWGSADSWLGIPVKWAQISGARCIIETNFGDIQVDPSLGSHFFQNIVSFGIGYLTVDTHKAKGDLLDLPWLDRQTAETETENLRHVALSDPLRIVLDGRKNLGVVLKPGS